MSIYFGMTLICPTTTRHTLLFSIRSQFSHAGFRVADFVESTGFQNDPTRTYRPLPKLPFLDASSGGAEDWGDICFYVSNSFFSLDLCIAVWREGPLNIYVRVDDDIIWRPFDDPGFQSFISALFILLVGTHAYGAFGYFSQGARPVFARDLFPMLLDNPDYPGSPCEIAMVLKTLSSAPEMEARLGGAYLITERLGYWLLFEKDFEKTYGQKEPLV